MATLKSQGVVLKRGDGGDPTEVFTAIGEVTAVSGVGGGSASEIDVTNLSSTAKEFILGLKDEGEVSVSLNLDTADTMQTGLRTDRDNNTLRNFELDLTDSGPTTISFSAFVKSYNVGIAVDSQITLEVSLRLSGAATWA
jgi:hypothetical protein